MPTDYLLPLEPHDAVFTHEHRRFVLVGKRAQEISAALVRFELGAYYKVVNDLRYFPSKLIAEKSERSQIIRAHQLPHFQGQPTRRTDASRARR